MAQCLSNYRWQNFAWFQKIVSQPAAVPHLFANPYDNEDRMYLTSVRWSWLEYELNRTTVGRTFTASSIFMSWEWPGISLVICRRVGGSPSTALTGRWFYFGLLQDSYSTVLYLWHDRCARRIVCGVYVSQCLNTNFTITTEIFRLVTDCTSGVWYPVEKRNFLSFTPSRPALTLTQLPIQLSLFFDGKAGRNPI